MTRSRAPRRLLLAACASAIAAASAPTSSATAPPSSPPRVPRSEMLAPFGADAPPPLVVYGTRDPVWEAALRTRAGAIARRISGDSSLARADRTVAAGEFTGRAVVLLGGPETNEWTRTLAPSLPVAFGERAFTWRGTRYDRPGDAIALTLPNPMDPKRYLFLVAANAPAALARRGGPLAGRSDWRITRDGDLAREGSFADAPGAPWRYDAALDRDFEAERARWESGLRRSSEGGLELRAPAGFAAAEGIEADARALLARLDRAGWRATAPARLTLYRSLEEKGVLARNTRPEHLDDAGGAHLALPFGRAHADLWTLAAQRLIANGARRDSPWLRPAATTLAGRFEGESFARAVSRLYFGRELPTAAQAAARESRWRSPLRAIPARALLARAVAECGGPRGRAALAALLSAPAPGTLDSLCRVSGVEAGAVTRRYVALADSLARAGARESGLAPRAWTPADGFQRGVCLAHDVDLESGYLSAACGAELARLRDLGATWVSLSPFGYLPDPQVPEILPSSDGGPDEETDEALCEAAARARALGLRVWFAPHLWTRGWAGDLAFTPSRWPRFFDAYREFALHYALLAEREGVDGFVIGHELASSTRVAPERWRTLIGEIRRVYRGTLTYDANWGEEVKSISFWDALDLVAVSFYYPLAKRDDAGERERETSARRALDELASVARASAKPVLVAEIGYPATAGALVRPWEEGGGAEAPESQRAGYESFVRAIESDTWLAGALFWKWPSQPFRAGRREEDFSPRGRPAEVVLRRALRDWEGRPVGIPRR